MSYDVKCGYLANAFLHDLRGRIEPASYSDTVARLAQDIQDAIEDFILTEGLDDDAPPTPQHGGDSK